jgi:tRNA-2-methylthio-N6-dimethylallyladenosine synthase
MDGQVPADVVRERYQRLVEAVDDVAWAENRAFLDREVEILVAEGEGRKDGHTHRLSGRARDNRLVHFSVPAGSDRPRPGDMVTATVTYAAPHHLVADSALSGGVYAVRRTRAGDAHARATGAGPDAYGTGASAGGVLLGMPAIGGPVMQEEPAPACAAGTI